MGHKERDHLCNRCLHNFGSYSLNLNVLAEIDSEPQTRKTQRQLQNIGTDMLKKFRFFFNGASGLLLAAIAVVGARKAQLT